MLEIKILKTWHNSEQEVKALLPFIQTCDIYTPENGFFSEKDAIIAEDEWNDKLTESCTRSKLVKELEKEVKPKLTPGAYAFVSLQAQYLLLNKKVVWYAERFSEADSVKCRDKLVQISQEYNSGLHSLNRGEVGSFLEASWNVLQNRSELTDIRDAHIAKNLETAEATLRAKYTTLSNQKNITLAIAIGALHDIEKYATIKVTTIDCRTVDVKDSADAHFREGKSFEELRPLMLVKGAIKLVEAGLLKRTIGEINEMNYETLRKYIVTTKASSQFFLQTPKTQYDHDL